MALILEITGSQAAQLGAASRRVFGPEGGVIGRANTSAWTLPHTKVSGRHALISYQNGVFYIEDTSTNGVFINSSKSRLVRGRPYALKSGDCILIDPYVIQVSVRSESEEDAGRPLSDPALIRGQFDPLEGFGVADPFADRRVPPPVMTPALDPQVEAVPGEVDPLKLLGGPPKAAPPRKAPSAQDLEGSSPLRAHYQPPSVAPAPVPVASSNPFAIPEDYDPLGPDEPPVPRSHRPGHVRPIPPAQSPLPPDDPFNIPADYDLLGSDEPSSALPPVPSSRSDRPTPVSTPESETISQRPSPIVGRTSASVPRVSFPETLVPASESSIVDEPPIAPSSIPANVSSPTPTPPEFSRPIAAAPPEGAEYNFDLGSVLAGAGLKREDVTPELARTFGEIFRVVVSGVMEVLRARQEIKDEFRMRMTQFRVADNNPLKFSANVDDALHNLLIKRNPAYLEPVEAFEDAFEDLRNHQVAMLAGMRTAFESMLAEFDPDRLQEQFDRQLKRASLLSAPAKLRYWELYRDKRDELFKDPDVTFRKLFGEQFAKAYEAQLERLKSQKRDGPASRDKNRQPKS